MDKDNSDLDLVKYKVWQIISLIPKGKVTTYAAIARLAGMPNRARWIGYLLRQLPKETRLPWHRVINASGRIAISNPDGRSIQQERLKGEGVSLRKQRIDFDKYGWKPEGFF